MKLKILLFSFSLLFISISCNKAPKNIMVSGHVFGTSYSVQYYSEANLHFEARFDSLFYVINKSMSTYQINSDISKLNRNESVLIDKHFVKVLETSREIYEETEGAFDPTIGILVNAWNFGPEGKIVVPAMLALGAHPPRLPGRN